MEINKKYLKNECQLSEFVYFGIIKRSIASLVKAGLKRMTGTAKKNQKAVQRSEGTIERKGEKEKKKYSVEDSMDRHVSALFLSPGLPCWTFLASVLRQRDISEERVLIHFGSVDRADEGEKEEETEGEVRQGHVLREQLSARGMDDE